MITGSNYTSRQLHLLQREVLLQRRGADTEPLTHLVAVHARVAVGEQLRSARTRPVEGRLRVLRVRESTVAVILEPLPRDPVQAFHDGVVREAIRRANEVVDGSRKP